MKLRYTSFIVFLSLCLLLGWTAPVAHAAEGDGVLSGKLVNGSTQDSPIANQTVTLQVSQGSNARDLTTATTDANGSFRFSNLSTEKTLKYAVYANYQGAHYTSALVDFANSKEQQVSMKLYEATNSTESLVIVRATVMIKPVEAQKDFFTVSEVYAVKNLSPKTYVGSLDTSQGKPNAFFFSLPKGAKNISLNNGFSGYTVVQVEQGFATNAAIPPGNSEFTFSFDVPYTGTEFDFGYKTYYPTVSLMMLVPTTYKVSAGFLVKGETITAEKRPYQPLMAQELRSNQEVHMKLEGLPTVSANVAATAGDNNTVGILIGLGILIVVLFVSAIVYRIQGRFRDTDKDGIVDWKDPNPNRANRKAATKRSQKKARATADDNDDDEAKKKRYLNDLKELDEAYEQKRITKEIYQERRARKKAQIKELMQEEA